MADSNYLFAHYQKMVHDADLALMTAMMDHSKLNLPNLGDKTILEIGEALVVGCVTNCMNALEAFADAANRGIVDYDRFCLLYVTRLHNAAIDAANLAHDILYQQADGMRNC